ncbi:MAG: hypothetical protein JXA89_09305, partial [Anaerolineae bacterium]|nr:hypothetical protein [Anaerolineae bacterium]
MQQQPKPYKRKLLSHERRPFRGPNASVVLNVRIKGEVTVSALRAAVKQVQRRHRLLSARVALDCDGTAWFTSDGAEEIVVDAVSRRSGEHWIEETLKAYRIPYEFDRRPPLRFILLHGPERSDLVIMCHHMICD